MAAPKKNDDQALIVAKKAGLSEVVNHFFSTKTPIQFIKTRPGPNGMQIKYVEVGYVINELNRGFGLFWEFQLKDKQVGDEQIWVQGALTIKDPKTGFSITKENFGGADIKKNNKTGKVVDIANDLKSAVSDCIKKCASMFGIASDVFFKEQAQYDQLDNMIDDELTDAGVRVIVSKKYFAVAAERGFSGDEAKEKIKQVFKVESFTDLSTHQLEVGIAAFEKKYKVVKNGEKPELYITTDTPKSPDVAEKPDSDTPDPQVLEAATEAFDGDLLEGDIECRCGCKKVFDPEDKTRDTDSQWFATKACQEGYYPQDKKNAERQQRMAA